MKILRSVLGMLAVVAASAVPAQAQSLRAFEDEGRADMRAMVGITIPFGGDRRAAESQPRFDLQFERSEIGADNRIMRRVNPIALDRRQVRRATVSLTFEEEPRFLVNGVSFDQAARLYSGQDESGEAEETEGEEREGRTTGQKVLRGAAVAGGVFIVITGVALAALIIDCKDDDGCRD